MHPPPNPAAPGPTRSILTRAPTATPPSPGAQPEPPGTSKRQRRSLEVLVVLRVRGKHLVEDAQEATVLRERARRGRQRRGGADSEGGRGRAGGEEG